MMLVKFAVLARKIHRLLIFLSIPLGLAQITTGLALLYPKIFFFLPASTAFSLHIATAPWFALVLFFTMLTGTYLYLHPYLQRWLRKPPPQN